MSNFNNSHEDRAFRKEHARDVSYTIPDGAALGAGYFCGLRRLRTIHVERDFDYDNSVSARYDWVNNIERFVVDSPDSPYFTEDGALFLNVTTRPVCMLPSGDYAVKAYAIYPSGEQREKHIIGAMRFPKGMNGKVLVAFPTAYPDKEYHIPEGTVAVSHYAFSGCLLERVYFPESIQYVCWMALGGMPDLRQAIFKSDDVRIARQHDGDSPCSFDIVFLRKSPVHRYAYAHGPWLEPYRRKVPELLKDPTEIHYEEMAGRNPNLSLLKERLHLDIVGTMAKTQHPDAEQASDNS